MSDDTIESLRANLAEVERERDVFRSDAVRYVGLLAQARDDADQALAAYVEMRAALEKTLPWVEEVDMESYEIAREMRILLSRTDLGRGMVAVPREMVERVCEVVGWYVDKGRGTPHGTRVAEKLLADLDALLKKGGG